MIRALILTVAICLVGCNKPSPNSEALNSASTKLNVASKTLASEWKVAKEGMDGYGIKIDQLASHYSSISQSSLILKSSVVDLQNAFAAFELESTDAVTDKVPLDALQNCITLMLNSGVIKENSLVYKKLSATNMNLRNAQNSGVGVNDVLKQSLQQVVYALGDISTEMEQNIKSISDIADKLKSSTEAIEKLQMRRKLAN